jgi:hypothetical protein
VKQLVWYTDGSKMLVGARARVYGQSWGIRLSIFPGKFATLACAYKVQMNARPQKHVYVLMVRWLWELFRLPKEHLHWYNSAKRKRTIFSPSNLWDCFGSPSILGYVEMKLPMGSQRIGLFTQFAGPEPALRVSRQNTRKIKRWTDNQHMAMWRGLTSTKRQLQKLISGPNPTAKTRLLSFHKIQSRVVTGLLTECNTLRRHLYTMGLILCRRCGAEVETSMQCECES